MGKTGRKENIEHQGIIQDIDKESVKVLLVSPTACSGCHAEHNCSMAGSKAKIIDIAGSYNYHKGEAIVVSMDQSMGSKALFLGYIIPMILVVLSLIIFLALGFTELASGLFSLSILAPYYLIIYLLREEINSTFTFIIKQ